MRERFRQSTLTPQQIQVALRQKRLVALVGRMHYEGGGEPVERPSADGGMGPRAQNRPRVGGLQVGHDGPGIHDGRAAVIPPGSIHRLGIGGKAGAQPGDQRIQKRGVLRRGNVHEGIIALQAVVRRSVHAEDGVVIHRAQIQRNAQFGEPPIIAAGIGAQARGHPTPQGLQGVETIGGV